jgi:hypothetical protein
VSLFFVLGYIAVCHQFFMLVLSIRMWLLWSEFLSRIWVYWLLQEARTSKRSSGMVRLLRVAAAGSQQGVWLQDLWRHQSTRVQDLMIQLQKK